MAAIILGISGATGAILGVRLLEELNKTRVVTQLIISEAAKKTIEMETGYSPDDIGKMAGRLFINSDITAPPASGSFLHQGMVIAPCSMKTLSAIANGFTGNLITRAADVAIKERRKLILLARETPLSAIHLENMLKLARLGVVIMPPVLSFYHHPETIEDITRQLIGRVFDQLGLDNSLVKRWT